MCRSWVANSHFKSKKSSPQSREKNKMEPITELLANYATKEVLTVITALGVAWVGWKAAAKSWGIASSFAQKASFMGITSAILMLTGLGVTGLGIGELSSRVDSDPVSHATAIEEASKPGFKNDQLIDLLTSKNTVSTELTREVLNYARNRDGQLPDHKLLELAEKNPQALTALIELMKAREERAIQQYEFVNRTYKTRDTQNVSLTTYETDSANTEFNLVEADESVITNADSLMSVPMAWFCILLGIGGATSGVTCFACRKSKRNPDDPHFKA